MRGGGLSSDEVEGRLRMSKMLNRTECRARQGRDGHNSARGDFYHRLMVKVTK